MVLLDCVKLAPSRIFVIEKWGISLQCFTQCNLWAAVNIFLHPLPLLSDQDCHLHFQPHGWTIQISARNIEKEIQQEKSFPVLRLEPTTDQLVNVLCLNADFRDVSLYRPFLLPQIDSYCSISGGGGNLVLCTWKRRQEWVDLIRQHQWLQVTLKMLVFTNL